MRVCFVGEKDLRSFSDTLDIDDEADLILFGFNGVGEVSYERELKGQTKYFEEIAVLSKKAKNIVVCGCVTDAHGHKRKSAVVAENGKLLGVSDRIHCIDGDFGSGAIVRVYETKLGRMGVVVAEDLYFFDIFKTLAISGSDFIVCPFARADSVEECIIRAVAYCYGVPVFFCAQKCARIADISGELAFESAQSPIVTQFTAKKEYHLVETRWRGFYTPKK